MIDLKAIRERVAICPADPKTLCESEAHCDRAQLLALVDELLSLTRRLADEAHSIDYEQERCLDDCPGCDADELLDVLEGRE